MYASIVRLNVFILWIFQLLRLIADRKFRWRCQCHWVFESSVLYNANRWLIEIGKWRIIFKKTRASRALACSTTRSLVEFQYDLLHALRSLALSNYPSIERFQRRAARRVLRGSWFSKAGRKDVSRLSWDAWHASLSYIFHFVATSAIENHFQVILSQWLGIRHGSLHHTRAFVSNRPAPRLRLEDMCSWKRKQIEDYCLVFFPLATLFLPRSSRRMRSYDVSNLRDESCPRCILFVVGKVRNRLRRALVAG